jgi:hypothetical protein
VRARWQWAALLPLLAAQMTLGACGGAGDERGRPRGGDQAAASADPTLAADSPVALTPYWPEGGAMAITGRLVLEDGCLYLSDGEGGRILPTFPWPGTHWEPKDGTLTIFGRHRFQLGEMLTAGGGFATSEGGSDGSDTAALQRMLVAPRPQCDTTRVAVLYFGVNDGGG